MDIELVFKVFSYLCGGISSVVGFFKNLKQKRQEAKDKKKKELTDEIDHIDDPSSVTDAWDDINRMQDK